MSSTPPAGPFEADAITVLESESFSLSTAPSSAKDFFRDTPWLNVPPERRAEILVEPLYPYRGLLGGSSAAPKQSKLGALAARRRKENEKADQTGNATPSSVALLDKLSLKSKESAAGRSQDSLTAMTTQPSGSTTASLDPPKPRKYVARKRPEPAAAKEEIKAEQDVPSNDPPPSADPGSPPPILPTASAFAQTLLGPAISAAPPPAQLSFGHYAVFQEKNTENPFAGPSPDDVVAKAQSKSKGKIKAGAGTWTAASDVR